MSTSINSHDDNEIALWGTQGGGLARWDADKKIYVWHELPDWYAGSGINEKIGDPIPEEWDVLPANEAALVQMFHEEDSDDELDADSAEIRFGRRYEMYNN